MVIRTGTVLIVVLFDIYIFWNGLLSFYLFSIACYYLSYAVSGIIVHEVSVKDGTSVLYSNFEKMAVEGVGLPLTNM